MKIAIFHPQISIFGGGEMVALTIASSLSNGNEVDIISSVKVDKQKLENFFCIDLKTVNMMTRPIEKFVRKLPSLESYKTSLQLFYLDDLR